MKIGVVTIIDYTNFGNRLQNYAVCQFLRRQYRCTVETLEGDKYDKPYKSRPIGWIKEEIARLMAMNPAVAGKRLSPRTIRIANFQNWSLKHIPRKRFYNCERLPDTVNEEYDCFLAGSDQIWNYHFASNRTEDFFLSFAENGKKNSISASFGVESIPEDKRQLYINGLSGFSHISVREDAGAEIIKDLLGRDVPVLVDPVMMLDTEEWMRVEKKPRADLSKPYVLKYYLGEEESEIDRWAKDNGYAIYSLMDPKNGALYSSGPGEFLSLIRNAALVCSDSFHCIVFSILFSTPFIVYERQGKENYMTSRLKTLLGKFGFENRWSQLLTPEEYLACDFTRVKDRLEIERKKFMDYMTEVIGE